MHSDFLFIIAEIAAAFAGFASLVAAISRREDRSSDQERLDFLTLQNVLLLSLLAVASLLYCAGFGFVRLFMSLDPSPSK